MSTKKSIKVVYDENRLLYSERKPFEIKDFDPNDIEFFLETFFAKRRKQKKVRKILFVISCIITSCMVVGIINTLNSIV